MWSAWPPWKRRRNRLPLTWQCFSSWCTIMRANQWQFSILFVHFSFFNFLRVGERKTRQKRKFYHNCVGVKLESTRSWVGTLTYTDSTGQYTNLQTQFRRQRAVIKKVSTWECRNNQVLFHCQKAAIKNVSTTSLFPAQNSTSSKWPCMLCISFL